MWDARLIANFDLSQIVDMPDHNSRQQSEPTKPAQQSTAFQYAVTNILPTEEEKRNNSVCIHIITAYVATVHIPNHPCS